MSKEGCLERCTDKTQSVPSSKRVKPKSPQILQAILSEPPLLRANVDLEEAWAPLIRHSESPLVREWLSRFPKEAATRRVEDLTRNKRGPSTNEMLGQTMSVIDLVPSEQLLTNIIEMANTLAKRRPKRRVACRDALREKCAAHPKVAASLDAAARALSAKERTFWLT